VAIQHITQRDRKGLIDNMVRHSRTNIKTLATTRGMAAIPAAVVAGQATTGPSAHGAAGTFSIDGYGATPSSIVHIDVDCCR